MEALRVKPETFLGKIFVTNITFHKFGPGVNPLMLDELPGLDADETAGVTLVFVAVHLHVVLHDVLSHEHLVTDGAGEGGTEARAR